MTSRSRNEAEVVVVGAGPSGLMLAHELAVAGVDTVVLEQLPHSGEYCPGQAANRGALELLAQRGVLADILADSPTRPTPPHFAMMFLDASPLAGLHEEPLLLGQEHIERHLERRAGDRGATILRQHRLIDHHDDGEGVSLVVECPAGTIGYRADYLVAADGEDSPVRERAGIPSQVTGEGCYGLVADVEIDHTDLAEIHRLPRRSPTGGLYSASPNGPGLVRLITAEFDVRPPVDREPGAAELQEQIRRLSGEAFPEAPVRRIHRYGSASRVAEHYRSARVLLVGDAAHTFFPLAGLRINTGLEDAVNLGWKLAAALRGHDVLDTYHDERHPAGVRAAAMTDAQLAMIYPPDRVAALRALVDELRELPQVNRRLLDISCGFDVAYEAPEGAHPLVGRRLATHLALPADPAPITVAEMLHAGRAVLVDPTGNHAAAAASWADRVEVVRVAPSAALDVAVLLRPDGRVGWAGDAATPEGLIEALARWLGPPLKGGRTRVA